MKSIVFLQDMSEFAPAIAAAAPGFALVMEPDRERALAAAADAEVLFGWVRGKGDEMLAGMKNLRWIQTWSAGVDYLPLAALAARGVYLTDASGVHTAMLSETAMALLLGLARGLHVQGPLQLGHVWGRKQAEAYGPIEVHGKTAGILGTGAVGGEVARLCKAFGMRTLGLSRSGAAREYVDEMFKTGAVDAMLPRCDFVLNLLPLTPETHHLMDAGRFAAMKQGGIYISVGRGPTTDSEALAAALQSGHLKAAGLDVVEPEPLPAESPLWDVPNLVILPHTGGLSPAYKERLLAIFLENLADYTAGRAPGRNLVDYEKAY